MGIFFSKMHSLGNDFMVVDGLSQNINFSVEQIQQLADSHRGVGFDQLLLLEPALDEQSDFSYRIFNASGDEVAQCGNGARCLGRFIADKQLSDKSAVRLATQNRTIIVRRITAENYSVSMGQPEFIPKKIPFNAAYQQDQYTIKVADKTLQASVVSMGNPHLVLCNGYQPEDIEQLGPALMQHEDFPEGVNVGFMKIIDSQTVELRVFERGVGETQACGSGACAAVVAGRQLAKLAETVTVYLPGGSLTVSWSGDQGIVELTGETTHVYDAELNDAFWNKE